MHFPNLYTYFRRRKDWFRTKCKDPPRGITKTGRINHSFTRKHAITQK